MREIKFRFVDDTGIVYNPMRIIDLVEQANYCTKHPNAPFISAKNNDYLTLNEFIRGMNKGEIEAEQFTGVLDSSDCETYEGDILHDYINDCNWQITYEGGSFNISTIEPVSTIEALSDIGLSDMDVMGNIHDNPELLYEREEKGE